jgi:hypothetical protein
VEGGGGGRGALEGLAVHQEVVADLELPPVSGILVDIEMYTSTLGSAMTVVL